MLFNDTFLVGLSDVAHRHTVDISLEDTEEPRVSGSDPFNLNIVAIKIQLLVAAVREGISLGLEAGLNIGLDGLDGNLLKSSGDPREEEAGNSGPPSEVEVVDLGRTVDRDRVVNQLAWKGNRHRRRGDGHLGRIEDERRMIATEVNGVITRSTDDGRGEGLIGAKDVDVIASTGTIDFESLNSAEVHQSTCSGHHTLGDNESIRDRGSDHYEGIHTRSTIDGNRSVVEVRVTVATHTTEEVGEVGDFLIVFWVFAKDEEGLEKEAVVTGPTVEIELGSVEVDLKGIVLPSAVNVEDIRSTIGDVFCIRDRDSLREFESPVPSIWDQRHRAHDDFVISVTGVDQGHRSGVIRKNGVIPGT